MRIKKSVKRVIVISLIVLLVVVLAIGGFVGYKKFKKGTNVKQAEVVDKIEDYGYYLEEDAPKGYKSLFDELRKVLNSQKEYEELYAKLVAQMLVFDFYNIDNKMSKNDVGGSQFIIENYRSNFILEASETVYKYVEHNVYGNRKQALPVVEETAIDSVKTNGYKYGKIKDDNAYIVKVNVSYKKDLGYPTSVTVKLIHTELEDGKQKLEVFYMK